VASILTIAFCESCDSENIRGLLLYVRPGRALFSQRGSPRSYCAEEVQPPHGARNGSSPRPIPARPYTQCQFPRHTRFRLRASCRDLNTPANCLCRTSPSLARSPTHSRVPPPTPPSLGGRHLRTVPGPSTCVGFVAVPARPSHEERCASPDRSDSRPSDHSNASVSSWSPIFAPIPLRIGNRSANLSLKCIRRDPQHTQNSVYPPHPTNDESFARGTRVTSDTPTSTPPDPRYSLRATHVLMFQIQFLSPPSRSPQSPARRRQQRPLNCSGGAHWSLAAHRHAVRVN
jgi:hypothetical protein